MKRRWPITVAILVGLIGLALFVLPAGIRMHRQKARKQWKEHAVAQIMQTVNTSEQLDAELKRLKAASSGTSSGSDDWLSDQLILMKNGEWIAYANFCQKQDWKIDDIFVGRASNGSWYYSTFHFCIHMITLRGEEQPESLGKFVEDYFLREFDGRSDECLKTTWPRR